MSADSGVLLSVRLMTYNHGKFIRQAMDGIFKQRTNFRFEVVVGDDFSKDDTLNIIREYKDSETITVRILDRKPGDEYSVIRKEKGRLYNFSNIVANCKGKYIAILDGDDYWTDADKLQKQVDFLESHPACSICFHRANVELKEKQWPHPVPDSPDGYYTYNDLFSKFNFITTAAVVFRNIGPLADWFHQLPYGDMGLYYMLTRVGSIYCMPETMSVYRLHRDGIWQSKKPMDAFMDEYNFYRILYPLLENSELEPVEQKITEVSKKIAKEKFRYLFFMRPFEVKKLRNELLSLRNT